MVALTGIVDVPHELVGAALSWQHTELACLSLEAEETMHERRLKLASARTPHRNTSSCIPRSSTTTSNDFRRHQLWGAQVNTHAC